MSLQVITLGFVIGLVAVLPPGPISLSLVEVSMSHGKHGGARGGLGIATGDIVMASAAGIVVLAGGAVPPWLFTFTQWLSTGVLVLIGGALLVRPGLCRALSRSIVHPGRTFFTLTALTPSVFGAWLAVIAAMPFAGEANSIAAFVAGMGVASTTYHVVLGATAGGFGDRISPRTAARLSRVGGAAMLVLAAWAVGGAAS